MFIGIVKWNDTLKEDDNTSSHVAAKVSLTLEDAHAFVERTEEFLIVMEVEAITMTTVKKIEDGLYIDN